MKPLTIGISLTLAAITATVLYLQFWPRWNCTEGRCFPSVEQCRAFAQTTDRQGLVCESVPRTWTVCLDHEDTRQCFESSAECSAHASWIRMNKTMAPSKCFNPWLR